MVMGHVFTLQPLYHGPHSNWHVVIEHGSYKRDLIVSSGWEGGGGGGGGANLL